MISLFIWLQRRVWSADGLLCRVDITPWPNITKKVSLRGYFCLLQAPFGAAAATEHCLRALFWSGVVAGAAQAPYWSMRLWRQWGVSVMCRWHHRWRVVHIIVELKLTTIIFYSFHNVDLLCTMPADCCMPRLREWGIMATVDDGGQHGSSVCGVHVLPCFHQGKSHVRCLNTKSNQQPTTPPPNYLHQ